MITHPYMKVIMTVARAGIFIAQRHECMLPHVETPCISVFLWTTLPRRSDISSIFVI